MWLQTVLVLSMGTIQLAPSPESKISFSIGYTLGTHTGHASNVEGSATFDEGKKQFISAKFEVPISSLTTGDPKKDCHMREAMGLRYESSSYPKKHVCDKNNLLPTAGVNAIAFPHITFELLSAEPYNQQWKVIGQWSIHGVTKKTEPFFATFTTDTYHLRAKIPLKLSDFGMVVKKFFVISVEDTVMADVDLRLRK